MKPVFASLLLFAAAQSFAAELFNPRTHDPSTIIKCNGDYWLFCTGNGILSRHSRDLKAWDGGPTVFTNAPDWALKAVPGNNGHLWAPDVIAVSNRYYLYYSVSTWGSRGSAIGLAINQTLNPADPGFKWVDAGMVVRSSNDLDYNTIDPAVSFDAEGNLWMAFGSFWSGIKLVQLDPRTGLRVAPDWKMYSLAYNPSIEAAYIYRHDKSYYLFVNWGQCCQGTNSTYEIRVGRSAAITGPYLDKAGVDLLQKGGTPFLASSGRYIGPGHVGILKEGDAEWLSCHFYDGEHEGRPSLAVRRLEWTADGWPSARLDSENR